MTKSNTRARFGITAPQLPNCKFLSRNALLGDVHRCLAVQAEIDDLNKTGDADGFAIALTEIGGFEPGEIDAMIRTRQRTREMFAMVGDLISANLSQEAGQRL